MNALPDIIRAVSPWAFAGLCVFSYFSGRLLAFMLRRITSGSTSVVFRFAFAVVRAFRLYVSGRDEAAEIQESFARSAMPVYRAM